MSDRELLELAAKAAGIEWEPSDTDAGKENELKFGLWLRIKGESTVFTRRRFNPLHDDGDALRLAVKLNINIGFGIFATQINCEIYDWAEDEVLIDWKEDGRKDPYAATRRAIVRIAAEIGRNMK